MMLRSYYKKDYAPISNFMDPVLGYFHNLNVF